MSLLASCVEAAPTEFYYSNVSGGGGGGTTYPITYVSNINATYTANNLTVGNASTSAPIPLASGSNGTYVFSASIVTTVSEASSSQRDTIVAYVSSSPTIIPYASINTVIPSGIFLTAPAFPYTQGVTGYFTISSASVPTTMQLGINLVNAGVSNACSYVMAVSNIYIQRVA
jgi:hypothetical protein